MQTDYLALGLAMKPLPTDTSVSYSKRRLQFASLYLQEEKPWSKFIWEQTQRYIDHCQRHPESWPMRILSWRGPGWYANRRAELMPGEDSTRSARAGRTLTRSQPRRVVKRWLDGFVAFGGRFTAQNYA